MRANRRSLIAVLLISLGLILISGTFYWFLSSSNPAEEPISVSGQEIPYPEVPRVSLADAKAAFDLGTAVFIDARDEFSFSQGHIPEAISIPVNEIEEKSRQLNSSDWYILYCT